MRNIKCADCAEYRNEWCEKVIDSPHPDMLRDCQYFHEKDGNGQERTGTDKHFVGDSKKGDTIYRADAIDAIDGALLDGLSEGTAIEILSELPPAQPEPCDDPRADVYYLAEKIGIHRLYALVVELRGEPEPCEDAVSREKVFEYFVSLWECIGTIMDRDEWEDVCKTTANELPSAQPEYEPVTAEDLAKTMSENTLYGFMAWHGEALVLMEEQGFVICKKTM